MSLRVTDNAGLGQADLVESTFASMTSATECSTPETGYIRHDRVTSGDIVVVDAQPLPTSKEHRKNGGWAQFGFKNQGRCVAFVQQHWPQPWVPGRSVPLAPPDEAVRPVTAGGVRHTQPVSSMTRWR